MIARERERERERERKKERKKEREGWGELERGREFMCMCIPVYLVNPSAV